MPINRDDVYETSRASAGTQHIRLQTTSNGAIEMRRARISFKGSR